MPNRIATFSLLLLLLTPQPLSGAAIERNAPRLTVGILLFEGVQIIDFTGPYEVFGQAGMEVWTASVQGKEITTHMGLRIKPTHSLAEAPGADILVFPGGNVPHVLPGDDPGISWLKERAAAAKAVFSVCNGVFYLASAGLLDGLRATTYAPMLEHLRMVAPKVKVVSDERVVDNGKIVTAGGLSAGIDGALHLVARHFGEARARLVANNMEYDWRPGREYNRGKLADIHIQRVIDFFPPIVQRFDEVYEGDESRWELRWRIIWPKGMEEMRRQFSKMARGAGWKRTDDSQPVDWDRCKWRFKDRRGRSWRAEVTIRPEQEGEVVLWLLVSLRTGGGG